MSYPLMHVRTACFSRCGRAEALGLPEYTEPQILYEGKFSNMKRILLIICISLIFVLLNVSNASLQERKQSTTPARIFYVATNGDDQWTGTLPARNTSGKDGPFATLQQARNAMRKLKQNGSKDIFTILVRGGIYHLNETFTLGPEDSGTESHPLLIKAYDNERPILCGTKTISNFKPYKNGIFRADLRGTIFSSKNIQQLFVAGKRQVLARFPNFDPMNPIGGGFLYVEKIVEEGSKIKFKYRDGAIQNWANSENAEVFIYPGPNYWNNILPVQEIDKSNHTITLSQNASFAIKPGNRYYFQNILDELDSPGEWYFDRREQVLCYWPQNAASLATVEVPLLNSIIEIKGDAGQEAPSNIRLEGFTLEGCAGSAILVTGAKRTVIARCRISNTGSHGIEIQSGSENSAIGNDIFEVSGTGIIISGGDRKTLTAANNRAENNYIHHIGIFDKASSGIDCRGVGNIVSHNLIHSTPRIGILFDGNDHVIEYNHVHHVNQETQDSGVIFTGTRDWTKRGNIIRFNYIHDSGGYGRNNEKEEWRSPFYTFGIYLDDWASGTYVYGNIVKDTTNGGIFIHGGRDNIIENNIIIDGGDAQMVYSSIPATAKGVPEMFEKIKEMNYTKYPLLSAIKNAANDATMSGNNFVRNIVYYTDKKSMLYGIYGVLDFAATVSDYNVIYHTGLPLLVPFTKVPANRQWQTWQGKGLDRNSIIADPLFTDIAKGDFSILPNSPAWKIGFKTIPIKKIGPYKDPMRASWPIQE